MEEKVALLQKALDILRQLRGMKEEIIAKLKLAEIKADDGKISEEQLFAEADRLKTEMDILSVTVDFIQELVKII